MKLINKNILSIVVLLLCIIGLIYYIQNHPGDFAQLALVKPGYLLALLGLMLLMYFTIGLITRESIKPLNIKLGRVEALGTALVTGFYNLITPFRGGIVARGVYLKQKHNLPYTSFVAATSASYLLMFLVSSLVSLVSMGLIYLADGIFSGLVFMAFLGIFIFLLYIVTWAPQLAETNYSWLNKFVKAINDWRLIQKNRTVFLNITGLFLIQLAISGLMYYLQFRVFGLEVSFVKCLFLAAVSFLAVAIGLTPAGLGVNEALVVFSGQAIVITPAQSLAATVLNRIVSVLVLFGLGPLSSHLLLQSIPPGGETAQENSPQ
jgi:uncharacterized protein (TIRG00374 family)